MQFITLKPCFKVIVRFFGSQVNLENQNVGFLQFFSLILAALCLLTMQFINLRLVIPVLLVGS